ncbi:DegT/DnrJ/EryC1/StrS family aminotransferase [Tritonibacter mobilis]|uniref:DegT/DnrJ/EryC1/StrS family aminotransferase n=1 Tax=Tritonibacter mobilis TaxID=379347 RepID=UPI0019826D9B|nr:DegT/DnrJ/EryC1/StrS family aminotransferase [Tritonibacter mobilis]
MVKARSNIVKASALCRENSPSFCPHPRFLDDWTERRRAIAATYLEGLKDSGLILPHVPEWAAPVWHLFVVRSTVREELQAQLAQADIGTLIHYPIPPHMQGAYADLGFDAEAFPIARASCARSAELANGAATGYIRREKSDRTGNPAKRLTTASPRRLSHYLNATHLPRPKRET